MNEIGAQLLYEKHASVQGVYADLSSGAPEYYVKCSECGNVHGMFSSVQDAINNKVCGACKFHRIQDFKASLEKVNDRPKVKPGKKRKLPWPLATESLTEEETGSDDGFGDDDEILSALPEKSWVEKALIELAELDGADPEDAFVTWPPAPGHNPDAWTKVEVTVGRSDYILYKDEDELVTEVEKEVADQIRDDPSNFAGWLVKQYIDEDSLRQVINSDMDEEDILQDNRSPWDWLEDIYGERDALRQACEMVNIDARGMAEECVRIDGWRHFRANGEKCVELNHGVLALPA